jgi:hypothetical protein
MKFKNVAESLFRSWLIAYMFCFALVAGIDKILNWNSMGGDQLLKVALIALLASIFVAVIIYFVAVNASEKLLAKDVKEAQTQEKDNDPLGIR